MIRQLLLWALCAGAWAQGPPIPKFIEETDAAGIHSRFEGDWEYIVGGGVAAFDCDGSGKPALWIAGGAGSAHFYRNHSPRGGALKFSEERAGLELTNALGAYPIDIDGDGKVDLAVLRVGETLLMRGLGDCKFERANERWGFNGGNLWATAFSTAWLGNNRRPTLALGTYIARAAQEFPWGSCTANLLFQPTTTGAASGRIYAPPRELTPGHCALSMLFSDWNRSGTPALRIANDREYYKGGQEQLFHIQPDGQARAYTAQDGWAPLQIWGMGIAGADLDGSGLPSYFITSMADNKLQALADLKVGSRPTRPSYKDVAYARGATAHRPATGGDVRPSTAWHAQFADVNNDGFADIFIVKGNVGNMPDFALLDPSNLLLGSAGGRFTEVAAEAGLVNVQRGRGGLMIDLNNDGLLDAVIVNRWDKARLWRNVGAGSADKPLPLGHWLQIRPRQSGGNTYAIGAWLEVQALAQGDASAPGARAAPQSWANRVQRRELVVGGGHASGALGFTHVGLGASTQSRVRVLWPGAAMANEPSAGSVSPWFEVQADRFYILDRQAGLLPWTPPP